MKKYLLLLFIAFTFFFTASAQKNILVDGIQRDYEIHLPSNYNAQSKLPVVFIFHGGGGNYMQVQKYFGMDAIADKENFICVYPNGINKQWNDGREFKQRNSTGDDAKFISQLLDTIIKNYNIDDKRIFATGISNGAFFSIYLSYKMNDRFLGIAPVCASIPEKFYDYISFQKPVSVLIINGTKDPLVPYYGGVIGNNFIGHRGNCTSTDKTIEKFISLNQTSTSPLIKEFGDKDRNDECTAVQYSYTSGKNKSSVVLIKIINGGHTLPGGAPYLPKFIIGNVCRDFNANEVIWNFFKNCVPD